MNVLKKLVSSRSLSLLALSGLFALSLTGCKSTPKSVESGLSSGGRGSVSDADISGDRADSDSGNAMGLRTINYDYDSSTLSDEAKSTLNANADILKEKSNLKIQIEGHTDERGGIQYNIALGERRAKAAKSYLTDKGIESKRITTISYGKEKPLDQGHDEGAWSRNRRANFRITSK